MLKYEEPEEHTRPHLPAQYQEADVEANISAEAITKQEIAAELLTTLATRERAQAYLDQQEGYAEKLMATVQTEARRFRKSRAMTRGIVVSMGILMGLLVLVFLARGIMQGKWDGDMFTSLISLVGVGSVAAASSTTFKSAVSELSAIEDLRAVGPLAESLDIEEKTVRAQVEAALIRLLPRLQASDAALLNREQRACLNKALSGKNEELIIAILRAYEQVGDEAALPHVEVLARESLQNPNPAQIARAGETSLNAVLGPKAAVPSSASVREAAQACLPFLRARIEQQRASQTLLRGSSAHEVAPDTLLRAAQTLSETPPDQPPAPDRREDTRYKIRDKRHSPILNT